MARQHNVNGVKIPFTAEEEAQTDIDAAEDLARIQAENEAEEARVAQLATDKASAVSKLEALGLSSSEIDALKQ